LFDSWDDALLFRTLATLRLDVPVFEAVDEIRWQAPRPEFAALCKSMAMPELWGRATSARLRAEAQTA
jgi:hypothetical protein